MRVRDAAEASSAATVLNRTAYGEYTDSGVPHVAALPSHWRVLPLKRLCLRSALYGANEAAETYADDGVRFLRTTDITDDGDVTAEGAVYVTDEAAADYMLQHGDLLLSRSGTLGRSLCFDSRRDGPCAYAGYLVRFIPGPRLVPRYAFWFTKSLSFTDWLRVSVIQSTIGNVNGQKYASMQMPAPPHEEQRAIADFLDRETEKIDALVAKKQRLIELLQEKRTSLISHAVTKGHEPDASMKDSGSVFLPEMPAHWDSLHLGRLSREVSDGPHYSPEYVQDGILFLSTRNIGVDGWHFADAECISADDFELFSRKVVPKRGDVLYTKGGTTGIARAVDFDEPFQVWVHVAVLKLRKELVNPFFLAYALNGAACYGQSQLYTRGATNNDLGLTRMVRIQLGLPPMREQAAIVRHLDSETARIDSLVATIEAASNRLKEYRSALITAAVTGQIDVRTSHRKAS